MITEKHLKEIKEAIDRYHRDSKGNLLSPPPLSPFVAQAEGKLDQVSKKIGVPTADLNEALKIINRELPNDYLTA